MELIGHNKNMMTSNDSRHIIKMLRTICGLYKYADYYKKIVKDGYFLNSVKLNGWGSIIDYNNNTIKITIGNFINDIPEPLFRNKPHNNLNFCNSLRLANQEYTITYSQSPYHFFINTKIDYEGVMTQKKEYYSHGILHEYISTENDIKEIKNKDVFIQIFIHSMNDFHNNNDLGNVIYDAKIVKLLPVTLHEMYEQHKPYMSLNDMLNDNILC